MLPALSCAFAFVHVQFAAFESGFRMLCDGSSFSMFRSEEVELLICGAETLDFEELQQAARYEDGYDADSPIISWFWECAHSMANDDKKKLLAFITGSDRVPIKGLRNLPIVISRMGPDSDRLPSAHTCFNHLLVPGEFLLSECRLLCCCCLH